MASNLDYVAEMAVLAGMNGIAAVGGCIGCLNGDGLIVMNLKKVRVMVNGNKQQKTDLRPESDPRIQTLLFQKSSHIPNRFFSNAVLISTFGNLSTPSLIKPIFSVFFETRMETEL